MNKHKALGLGSNVGDRKENLLEAIRLLGNYGVCIIKKSSVYETEPVDCTDECWFLNQVVFVKTDLTPRECLRVCKRIEAEMGRKHSYRNAPRVIDIDLLLWEEIILKNRELAIPHKSIHGRKFVLIPLLEIAEGLEILEWLVYTIHDQGIRKYE